MGKFIIILSIAQAELDSAYFPFFIFRRVFIFCLLQPSSFFFAPYSILGRQFIRDLQTLIFELKFNRINNWFVHLYEFNTDDTAFIIYIKLKMYLNIHICYTVTGSCFKIFHQ